MVSDDVGLDLDAYFERIGVRGGLELAQIHTAHVCSIPFENLDPHRGVRVLLDVPALERKLVAAGRGGYCFEHNLLFKAALEAQGALVDMMLARVRWGAPEATVRPLAHLVLRVRTGGHAWHADVGFGAGTLLEPIPFGPGGPYEQRGWRFRVVEEGTALSCRLRAIDSGVTCTCSRHDRGADRRRGQQLVHLLAPGFGLRFRTDRRGSRGRWNTCLAERLEWPCARGANTEPRLDDARGARGNPSSP